jgi:hypothetical protein
MRSALHQVIARIDLKQAHVLADPSPMSPVHTPSPGQGGGSEDQRRHVVQTTTSCDAIAYFLQEQPCLTSIADQTNGTRRSVITRESTSISSQIGVYGQVRMVLSAL